MKSIGVVGCCGFVGSAVVEGMRHAFQVWGYDKKCDGIVSWKDGKKYELTIPAHMEDNALMFLITQVDGPIFLCVPTPMNEDGSADVSIVESVVKDIDEIASLLDKCQANPPVVVIKSTVPPGTTNRLNCEHKNIHVCFNPEFLREATALEDF